MRIERHLQKITIRGIDREAKDTFFDFEQKIAFPT